MWTEKLRFFRRFVLLIALSQLAPISVLKAETVPLITLAELRAKYALPNSQYANIRGVEVHFVDEGNGPPVVILHGTGLNLRTWDKVADILKDKHRVIRLDLTASGLTGSDSQQQESMERNLEILEGLISALGLKQVAFVGASGGGIVAFRYAAEFTDKVTRLVLINSGGMPRTPQNDEARPRSETVQLDQMPIRPRDFYKNAYDRIFVSPHESPEWLVNIVYDVNRREGLNQEINRFFSRFETGTPKETLARVKAPTLILWGRSNFALSYLEADVFQHWMVEAPTLVKKYDGVGHYAYMEIPDVIGRDIQDFLMGKIDNKLRRTTMVPVHETDP